MTDDLLDYTADTAVMGKGVGTDLKEGKLTLPIIFALGNANRQERAEMEAFIEDHRFSEDDFKRLVAMLRRLGGIDYTLRQADNHVTRAKKAMDMFPPSEAKSILLHMADYAMIRNL